MLSLHSQTPIQVRSKTQVAQCFHLCVCVCVGAPAEAETQAGTKDLGNEPSTSACTCGEGRWQIKRERKREGKKESHSHPRHGQTAPAFRISRTLRLFLCCGIAFIVENSNSLLGSLYFAFELAALLFCFCHSACKPRESGSAIGHQVEKQTHTTAGERWRERPRSPHAKRSPCKKLLDTKMHFLKTIPRLSSSEYSSTFNS